MLKRVSDLRTESDKSASGKGHDVARVARLCGGSGRVICVGFIVGLRAPGYRS